MGFVETDECVSKKRYYIVFKKQEKKETTAIDASCSVENGFGDYLKSSAKFFCKGHFDKDKDSHDAGLEPLKGKRVLLADELKKSMKLDDALVKNLAGGHYVVEGRKIGIFDQFKFVWQAGIIMVFQRGRLSLDIFFLILKKLYFCWIILSFGVCYNTSIIYGLYLL